MWVLIVYLMFVFFMRMCIESQILLACLFVWIEVLFFAAVVLEICICIWVRGNYRNQVLCTWTQNSPRLMLNLLCQCYFFGTKTEFRCLSIIRKNAIAKILNYVYKWLNPMLCYTWIHECITTFLVPYLVPAIYSCI